MLINDFMVDHITLIGSFIVMLFVIVFSLLKTNNFKRIDYIVLVVFMLFAILEHNIL